MSRPGVSDISKTLRSPHDLDVIRLAGVLAWCSNDSNQDNTSGWGCK